MRMIKTRTKIESVAIASFLIVITVGSVLGTLTLRDNLVKYDDSPLNQLEYSPGHEQINFSGNWSFKDSGLFDVNTKIWNTNGKIWNATASNIPIAIDDLSLTGGSVHIPDGDYDIPSIIYVDHDNITVKGDGKGTILRFAGGAGNWFIMTIGNCKGTTIENINFLDPDPLGHGGGEESHGINVFNSSEVKIINCFFTSLGDESITIVENSSRVIVDNCFFYNYSSNSTAGCGVSVDSGTFVIVSNCIFSDNSQGYAINIETPNGFPTHNITICNNLIKNHVTTSSAIHLNSGTSEVSNIIISDNIINTSHIYAINSTGSQGVNRVTVNNNILVGGVRFVIGTDHLVSDNFIKGAIDLSSADNVVIDGNYIYDTEGRAVYFFTSENGQVTGNKIINCGNGGSEIIEKSTTCTGRFIAKDNFIDGSHSSSHAIVTFDIVDGNYIYNCGGRGIHGGKIITNNWVQDSGGYGIDTWEDYINITNNVIIDANNRGIYLGGSSDYCFVSGNMISGGHIGIDEEAGATNNSILGNHIMGANSNIKPTSSTTVVLHNIGYMTIFPLINITEAQPGFAWYNAGSDRIELLESGTPVAGVWKHFNADN